MAFSLAVDTSGAAFDNLPRKEVARIMRAAANVILHGYDDEGVCRDVDGNVVGMWRIVGIGE